EQKKIDDQKKAEDEKKKADATKVATAAPLAATTPSPVATPPSVPDKEGSLSLPSPDGMWRGTYACAAVSSTAPRQNFILALNLQIANGISSGGGFPGIRENAGTLNIGVTVDPPKVTVTRTYIATWGTARRTSMPGQYDGASIRASSRQQF